MSRATARSDRLAPSVARCRRAVALISSIICARTRARTEAARMARLLHTFESSALDMVRPKSDPRTHQRAVLSERRERAMSLHVIVGAGVVGSAAARLLVERGEQVRLVS